MRSKVIKYSIIILVILLNLVACNTMSPSAPANKAKGFIRAIFSGDPSNALDYMCIEQEGIVFIIAVEADWDDDRYEIILDDGQTAQVNVFGRLRITAEELQSYLKEETDMDLPRTGVGFQMNINFKEFYLRNESGKWCVAEQSIINLRNYLIELFIKEIEY